MAAIPAMALTQEGKKLYSRVHSGEKIEFTAVKVGNGYIGDEETADDITSLKNEVSATVDIINLNPADTGTICLVTRINSSDTDFYLREIGVFAKIEPDKEVLYGYCNYGDNADYINTFSGSFPVTQEINIYIAVGETKNINVNISDTTVVTPYDLQSIKNDISKLNESKLSYKFVESLPTEPMIYNFEDGVSRFSIPKQGEKSLGKSTIDTNSTGEKYQAITTENAKSASGVVYSSMRFGDLPDSSQFNVEFDYKMKQNGRHRIVICDVSTVDEVENTLLKKNSLGVAVDIYSNRGNILEVNGKETVNANFFGEWMHVNLNIDFSEKTVQYEIALLNNANDKISGTTNFKDENLDKITGIAVYTWIADEIDFDNISIIAKSAETKNMRYLVKTNSGYSEYMYADDIPVCIGSSTVVEIPELANASHSHDNKEVLDRIYAEDVNHWDSAVSVKHTHSNKSVLDGITNTGISNWNSAVSAKHTHSNKSALDTITAEKINDWNTAAGGGAVVADGSITKAKLASEVKNEIHTHSNKSTLDKITELSIENWDASRFTVPFESNEVPDSDTDGNVGQLCIVNNGSSFIGVYVCVAHGTANDGSGGYKQINDWRKVI